MELRDLILQIPKQKIKALCMKTVFRSVRDLFWASRNSKDPKQVPEASPVPLGGDGVTPCSREGRQRSGCFIQAGTNQAEQQRGTAGKLCLRLVKSLWSGSSPQHCQTPAVLSEALLLHCVPKIPLYRDFCLGGNSS